METVLILVAIIGAVVTGLFQLRNTGRRLSLPPVTAVLAAVTAVVSVAAELVPGLLDTLRRDPVRLTDGEWWRLVTPLFAQDGGWTGLIFNLVCLFSLGIIVESRWGWRWLLPTYFAAGLVSEVAAYTLLTDQGFAGNSVANLGLAGLLAVCGSFDKGIPTRLAGLASFIAGLVLLVNLRLHGIGYEVGVIAGVVLQIVILARTRKGATAEAVTPSTR